jgi:hypothetical protein
MTAMAMSPATRVGKQPLGVAKRLLVLFGLLAVLVAGQAIVKPQRADALSFTR